MEDDSIFFHSFLFSFISIHVPRVEDDSAVRSRILGGFYFNPRPPCGGRRSPYSPCAVCLLFQSTSPVWRTTNYKRSGIRTSPISIHVPRVEDDDLQSEFGFNGLEFQSTSPVWRTTYFLKSHVKNLGNFNPRPPCGGRLNRTFCIGTKSDFNPRPPCGGRRII